MTDYRIRYDVGSFGTDNPTTEIREVVPFVVQTDGRNKFVNIGIANSHGTFVSGIAGGKSFFGGSIQGVAPEAQIVSARACMFNGFCSLHGIIEGMIFLAKQANAEVINMSIGSLPSLNDGNSPPEHSLQSADGRFNVVIVVAAGNDGLAAPPAKAPTDRGCSRWGCI
jgi:subtilisin family serine protease